MLKADPLINKEHGSWAILLVPPFTALLSLREFSSVTILFLFALLSAFLIARPAEIWFQDLINKRPQSSKRKNAFFWLTAYTVSAIIFTLLLLIINGSYGLLIFGAAGIAMILISQLLQAKYGKTIGRDLAGIAGLTLGAPTAYYVHTGMINSFAWQLWLFNLLFFASGAFYVHSLIEQSGKQEDFRRLNLSSKFFLNLSYHIMLIIFLIIFISNNSLLTPALAFIPMIVHVFLSMIFVKGKANFKKIGFTLLGYSIFFGIVIGTMK